MYLASIVQITQSIKDDMLSRLNVQTLLMVSGLLTTVCAEMFTVLNFHSCIIEDFRRFYFRGREPRLFYTLYTVLSIMVSSLILYEPSEQLKVEQPFPDSGFRS